MVSVLLESSWTNSVNWISIKFVVLSSVNLACQHPMYGINRDAFFSFELWGHVKGWRWWWLWYFQSFHIIFFWILLSAIVSNNSDKKKTWQLFFLFWPLTNYSVMHIVWAMLRTFNIMSVTYKDLYILYKMSLNTCFPCIKTPTDLSMFSCKIASIWDRLIFPQLSVCNSSGSNRGNLCMPLKQSVLFIQSPWTSRIRKFLQWILIH